MASRTKKPSSTKKQPIPPTVTGRRVKLRPGAKLTTTVKPKKFAKPGPSAKRRVIPPATRADHRPPSTAKKSAMFTLDAPGGFDVAVAGTFNNWEPQAMTRGTDGLWRISFRLAPGTYEYKFLVDAEWREDPNNPRKRPNEHGSVDSVCEVM